MANGNGNMNTVSTKALFDGIIKILIALIAFLSLMIFNLAHSNETRITVIETHYEHISKSLESIEVQIKDITKGDN